MERGEGMAGLERPAPRCDLPHRSDGALPGTTRRVSRGRGRSADPVSADRGRWGAAGAAGVSALGSSANRDDPQWRRGGRSTQVTEPRTGFNTHAVVRGDGCDDAPSWLPWRQPFADHRRSFMRRRSVLLSAVSGTVAGTLTLGHSQGIAAHQGTPSLADHPLTGDWMAMANRPPPGAPQVPAPSHFGADGSVLLVFPPTQVGMQGVEFVSPHVGTWEADSDRRGHFTATQLSQMRPAPSSAPSPSMDIRK